MVVALAVSLPMLVLPASPVEAATSALYLKATGVPKASLGEVTPTAGSLPNYDANRDSAPGLLLQKTSKGWKENDASKHEVWVSSTTGQDIDAQVSLTFWSAMKDFNDEKRGRVEAYLLDCNAAGASCSLVGQAVAETEPWSESGSWKMAILEFGSVTHTMAANRALAVKLVVGDDSDDDMWFAYDTTTYPSRLTFETEDTTSTTSTTVTTTTTTTTTVATTTTIVSATTTIDRPGNRGSTPLGPPNEPTTTTTAASSTSTSTTDPPATTTTEPGGSTTTTILLASGPGPGGPDSTIPGPVDGRANEQLNTSEPDPSVSAMAVPAAEGTSSSMGAMWSGSLLEHLELVMPPWAAGAVTSPLLILGFVIDAMTDSGRAIMLPVSLLMAGIIWIMFENRAFALSFFARDRREEDADR